MTGGTRRLRTVEHRLPSPRVTAQPLQFLKQGFQTFGLLRGIGVQLGIQGCGIGLDGVGKLRQVRLDLPRGQGMRALGRLQRGYQLAAEGLIASAIKGAQQLGELERSGARQHVGHGRLLVRCQARPGQHARSGHPDHRGPVRRQFSADKGEIGGRQGSARRQRGQGFQSKAGGE